MLHRFLSDNSLTYSKLGRLQTICALCHFPAISKMSKNLDEISGDTSGHLHEKVMELGHQLRFRHTAPQAPHYVSLYLSSSSSFLWARGRGS